MQRTYKIKFNQTKQEEKNLQNPTELNLCWQSIAGHRACPSMWFIYPMRLNWKKLNFPLCGLQLGAASWLGLRTHVLFPLSVLGPHLS